MIDFGKTLVIAAHPDDDVLGCGGLIKKLTNSGESVRVIFIAEGTSCRFDNINEQVKNEILFRSQCGINALKILGVDEYNFYDYPCGRLDVEPIMDLGKVIEKEIINYKPKTILTHGQNDVHVDHKTIFQAVLQATRPVNNIVKNLLSFEILSSTEWRFVDSFKPNFFVDITDTLDSKIDAMNCYTSEQPKPPHPRSDKIISSLASLRGSQSGTMFSEGFEVVRIFY
jgi:LmbE family N-acetylglucosaminyl deacetylase